MKSKLDEEICLFVRDAQTRRFLFNADRLLTPGTGCELRTGAYFFGRVRWSAETFMWRSWR